MSFGGFNANRTKVHLKLAVSRLKLLQQKKTEHNKAARREIASLLEKGKEESARVRVEHVIREDFNCEALEILELLCEMLLARWGLVESMKHCDQAISEAVNTIIYAAPRVEVKELQIVRDQLIRKFGSEFAAAAMENQNDVVNERIVHKLKVQTPGSILVNQYLKTIAKGYNIEWEAGDFQGERLLGTGNGAGGVMSPPAPAQLGDIPYTYPVQYTHAQQSPHHVPAPQQHPNIPPQHIQQQHSSAPESSGGLQPQYYSPSMPSAPNDYEDTPHHPNPGSLQADLAQPATAGSSETESLPNFDELAKRFEALKRRK
ncbi:regulator of Vps4 activity in the MVB pathway-domain-containing protein [Gaertneriomyces semiglobifer]|nr:regulator of Vps4 activity in the MVB pathway-domain-containing protein [Gaertneriomyces semiglobifer]